MLGLGVCCVPPSLFSQTTPEPVPSKWLHDGKLVVDDFNFTVDTPNPDAQWSYVRLPDIQGAKAAAFVVAPSTDKKLVIVVWDKTGSMGSGSTKDFVDGMTKSMPKDWQIADAKIEPSAFPLKDSSKFTVTVHLPNEQTLYAYGYLVTGGRTYELLTFSPETTEPSEFHHFVGSFAFIKAPTAGNDFMFYALFVGFVLACQGILIWISVKAKPLAGQPYRWGTYVGIITGLAGASFLLITLPPEIDVYAKGAGAVMGLCSIVCAVGILRRRKYGAVMFVITYVLIIMVVPFLDAVRNRPVNPQQRGQALPTLIFLIMTTVYFKRRWNLMGSPKLSTQPVVAAMTAASHQESARSEEAQQADVDWTSSTIEIKSTPDGAEITVDDKFVGNTPSTLRLQPGDHSIRIEKPGFKAWTRILSVASGSTATISAGLESQ